MPISILDVTLAISDGLPVWPDDPPVTVVRVSGPQDAAPAVSSISLSSHAGTHVDPPAHFVPDGLTVDELPLDVLIGPAWVAHIPGTQTISAANLDAASIPADITRLLIRTDNSARATASLFATMEFAALATDAKDWLLDRRVRLVGIDGPSVELPISPEAPVHRALLGAGVIVVEGLDLAEVAPGTCQLICLPLRIAAGDGSPARVVLVRDV